MMRHTSSIIRLLATTFAISATPIVVLGQESLTREQLWRDAKRQRDPVIRRVFVRGIRQYLKRDFHPSDNDNWQLAAQWFAAHGMTLPDAA